ncbi:MAG TPA: hypothetical protein DIS90_02450 [Cytophagales bacterium]|mgnify:CR=1 FL=1|nr:hypothetical protein [Cytophagales bacterium]HCR53279.1 hypothetical protein [Cytophagales bacterium]
MRLLCLLLLMLFAANTYSQPMSIELDESGKAGLMRGEQWIVPAQYDELDDTPMMNGVPALLAKKGNLWGVIDTLGKTRFPFIYEEITHAEVVTHPTLWIVRSKSKFGLIDMAKGKTWINPEHKAITLQQEVVAPQPYLWVGNGKSWGALDSQGNLKIPFTYDEVSWMETLHHDYLWVTKKQNKYGLFNLKEGKEVVPSQYDEPYYEQLFINGHLYLVVKQKGKAGVITLDNTSLIPCAFDGIELSLDETAFITMQRKGKVERYGKTDASGKVIMVCAYSLEEVEN